MINTDTSKITTSDRELVITRLLNAPRELVWEAWTDPKQVAIWWGPNGFTTTTQEINIQVGGKWKFIMHGPDGVDYPNQIIFIEIDRPRRLLYTHGTGIENDPDEFRVEVTFKEKGNKTELTMQSIFKTAGVLQKMEKEYGAIEGAKQHLARLEQYLTNGSVE